MALYKYITKQTFENFIKISKINVRHATPILTTVSKYGVGEYKTIANYLLHPSGDRNIDNYVYGAVLKLSDQGNAFAQYAVAKWYVASKDDDLIPEGVKLFHLSADQGYATAQASLGWMYYVGSKVEQNFTKTVYYCRKAIEQGHFKCTLNNIGLCYEFGHGVQQNKVFAAKLYMKAIDKTGEASAQYNLGRCYEFGCGVERNDIEAYRLYKLSADMGFIFAKKSLARCYMYGKGVNRDFDTAFKLLKDTSAVFEKVNLQQWFYAIKNKNLVLDDKILRVQLSSVRCETISKYLRAYRQTRLVKSALLYGIVRDWWVLTNTKLYYRR